MELKSLAKEWRIWVLVSALALSTLFLAPTYGEGPSGETTIETSINKGLELSNGTRVLISPNSTNTSQAQAQRVADIIQTRISAFGLTQASVRTVRLGEEFSVQVEVASQNRTRLRELISEEGSFEARMPWTVRDNSTFSLDGTDHSLTRTEQGLRAMGETYSEGDTWRMGGTKWYYANDTDGSADLEMVAYNGSEVDDVLTSSSQITGGRGSYQFRFQVVIDNGAAERVQEIARNYETVIAGGGPSSAGQPYLGLDGRPARLGLYVDENRESGLRMAGSFKNSVVNQPSISGGATTNAEAEDEMQRLQAILQSGALPVPVKIDSFSTVSSSLGSDFLSAAFLSIIASLVAVGGLVFLRYGDIRVVVPIIITGASEVYIVLGTWFSTVATLDLASIAGIIAAVGTGVDDQIIITDESSREQVRSWKKRMKRAFFVIFTSAASTIGAMMPIVSPSLTNILVGIAGLSLIGYTLVKSRTNQQFLVLGTVVSLVAAFTFTLSPSAFALQSVRGFAVTTILGVLVGITITRPAFAKILEQIQ
nr:MAG: preprotein translocase subunit SecD [Candidatus Nanosalinarum sp. J07AB56]